MIENHVRAVSPPDILPPAPRWGWKPDLSRGQLLRPDHDLLAVLPLDRDRLVGDLEAALVDREIANDGLGLERQKGLAEPVGIQAPGLSYHLRKELTPGIRAGRLNGGSAVEFLFIRRDELPVSGVSKARLPKRAAVDELRFLSELPIVLRKQAIWNGAEHPDVQTHFPHLPSDGDKVLEANRGRHQDIGLGGLYFVQKIGEIGSDIRVCLRKDQLQAVSFGEFAGPFGRRVRDEPVQLDYRQSFEPVASREIKQPLREAFDGSKHHDQVAAPLLPYRGGRRHRRDHDSPVFLGGRGIIVRKDRTVQAEHRIDLVLCKELLVKTDGGFLIGAIVVDHELDRTSKDSALRVHMLLAQQVSLATVAALHGVSLSGDRHRGANPDRLLGRAWPRQPKGKKS